MNVQLFPTCLVDSFFPEIAESVYQVLNQAGVTVQVPGNRTCCGQPAMNAGFPDDARQIAKHMIQVLGSTANPVVIPSGSCTAMVKQGYLELFADDPLWEESANTLASRVFELTEFLVDVLSFDSFGASYSGPLHYLPSCHSLRQLEIDRQPQHLLGQIEDAELHCLPKECCGFGGVFALEFADISSAMLARTLQSIPDGDSEVVTGTDVSCLMHIEGSLRKSGSKTRCAHIAQILNNRSPGLR